MKVLFCPLTGSSIAHTVRCLSLADELKKEKGVEIFFTSCSKRKDFIENAGYKVLGEYETVNLNDPNDQSSNFFKNNSELFFNWFKTEIEITKYLSPDIVVNAPSFFGPYIKLATGTKVIGVTDSQYLPESKGLMGLSLCRENSLKDKLIRAVIKPFFEKKFINEYLKIILEIYSELGIDVSKIKSRKELYKKEPVLIPSDHIMEPIDGENEHLHYTGPLFWDGFEKMNTGVDEKTLKNIKKDKKIIYVSFGASIFKKDLYNTIIHTISRLPYFFVIGIGPNFERKDFPEDTESMIIRKYTPGKLLSKFSDIIINTGSQGSVSQGLLYGKPQISLPTTMDQSFFANRLEEIGAGINIKKVNILKFSKRENFSKIPNNLSHLLEKSIRIMFNDNKYKKNAENLSKVIRSYRNPAKIGKEIIIKIAKSSE